MVAARWGPTGCGGVTWAQCPPRAQRWHRCGDGTDHHQHQTHSTAVPSQLRSATSPHLPPLPILPPPGSPPPPLPCVPPLHRVTAVALRAAPLLLPDVIAVMAVASLLSPLRFPPSSSRLVGHKDGTRGDRRPRRSASSAPHSRRTPGASLRAGTERPRSSPSSGRCPNEVTIVSSITGGETEAQSNACSTWLPGCCDSCWQSQSENLPRCPAQPKTPGLHKCTPRLQ